MKTLKSLLIVAALCVAALSARAQNSSAHRSEMLECTVRDSLRRALVFAPAGMPSDGEVPLVFVFHGRRGVIEKASRRMCVHELWGDAVVVYPQGLWTTGGVVGAGYGWVMPTADDCGRDIEFFDALLDTLRHRFRIDERRIYCMGHSNGGGFVQALWSVRGDVFAAVASVHSGTGRMSKRILDMRRPKPVFFAGGSFDEIVRYDRVLDAVYSAVELNGCKPNGRKMSEHVRLFRSPDGNDVAAYLHSGGHRFPEEALPHIVGFFRSHPRKR
jgi:putative poly(3-hydroxybutyrate) depolymerase